MPYVAVGIFGILFLSVATPQLSQALANLIASVIEALPAIGPPLGRAIRSLGQAVANFFGKVFSGITHAIGASLHYIAHFLTQTWAAMSKTANVLAHVAKIVGDTLYHVTGLQGLVHELRRLVHTIAHRFVTIGREIYRLRLRVHKLERDVAQGIGDDLLPRVKTLERELAHAEDVVIPNVRDLAQAAENDVTALAQWVKDHALLVGTSALTGAVAWALSQLGLGGLRCNSNPFKNNPKACGLWGDLADILGLVVAAELALNFDELVHSAQEVAEVTTTAVQDVFGLSG